MSIKSELRKEVKIERSNIENREQNSKDICNSLLSNKLYKESNTILCYSTLNEEVNTNAIIETVLNDNKTLALPFCLNKDGIMDFYVVKSIDDLINGSFGILEPDICKCNKLIDYNNAIIIVPALCFDKQGYRLGYGKGYYDRFLQIHPLISIGLCYNTLVKNEIPHDKYDLPVDYIITESQIIKCDNGGKNG